MSVVFIMPFFDPLAHLAEGLVWEIQEGTGKISKTVIRDGVIHLNPINQMFAFVLEFCI